MLALGLQYHQFTEYPKLNQARSDHGATVIGSSIFVYGGEGKGHDALDTIERLNVEANEDWSMFSIPGIGKRFGVLVCSPNDMSFVIAGGFSNDYQSDVILVYPEFLTAGTVIAWS